MRKSAVSTGLTVLCVVLSATIVAAQEVETVPLKLEQVLTTDGDVLYGELCAVCHGADAKGGGPAAEAMAMAVPDLTALAAVSGGDYPAERVEKAITSEWQTVAHGSREMPMWGAAFSEVRPNWGQAPGKEFARLRIRNLVDYIESLQAQP